MKVVLGSVAASQHLRRRTRIRAGGSGRDDESPGGNSITSEARLDRNALERKPSALQASEFPLRDNCSGNPGKELALGTLNAILKKAGLK